MIRNSQEAFITEPAFCAETNPIIEKYLGAIGKYLKGSN
jgi:hypothetical protein